MTEFELGAELMTSLDPNGSPSVNLTGSGVGFLSVSPSRLTMLSKPHTEELWKSLKEKGASKTHK